MSAGNTVSEADHVEAFAGRGSPSINTIPTSYDHQVDTAGDSPHEDYAHTLGTSGAREARPSGDGVSTRPGSSYGGWTQTP